MGKPQKAAPQGDFFNPELDAADVFEPTAFQSMATAVTALKNITTRTEVEDLSMTSVVEVHDKGITIETHKAIGAKGHSLMIKIKTTAPSKGGTVTQPFEATASIKATETTADGSCRVDMDFVQYEERGWQRILSMYAARQEEIDQFLMMVKG